MQIEYNPMSIYIHVKNYKTDFFSECSYLLMSQSPLSVRRDSLSSFCVMYRKQSYFRYVLFRWLFMASV